MRFLAVLSFCLLAFPLSTFAAPPTCSVVSEGVIVYNKDHKIMQFCDGVKWIGMSGSSAGTIDTLSSLSCANDEIAKWNGTTWACAADGGGTSSVWIDGGSGKIYYNGGNVGIGTADPDAPLQLLSNLAGDNFIHVLNTNSGGRAAISFGNDLGTGSYVGVPGSLSTNHTSVNIRNRLVMMSRTSTTGISLSANQVGGDIRFMTEGTTGGYERMRITTSGIGIGTFLPDSKLHVVGTLKIGDGAELCNSAAHEGAIRYVAATDAFQMCRNSVTGWESIGTGGGLPALTSANIWVGNGTNVATAVAISGDATMSNTGVLALDANSVASAELADDAVGLAELSATGTADATTYLRGDNTWAVPSAASGIPAGAVMAFDLASCPSGWTALAGASGRVIVGVGSNGVNSYALNNSGGSDNKTLLVSHMPAHQHSVDPAAVFSGAAGAHNHTLNYYDSGSGNGNNDWAMGMNTTRSGPQTHNTGSAVDHQHSVDIPATATTSQGSGAAFDIRPAYLALLYCKKS